MRLRGRALLCLWDVRVWLRFTAECFCRTVASYPQFEFLRPTALLADVPLAHQAKGATMANINVSYAEMEQAATQLGAGRDEITEKLRVLQNQINNLVSSGFVTDQASGKFNAAYTDYTASANTVVLKLSEIQSFLTQTSSAMREMDAQIASRIN